MSKEIINYYEKMDKSFLVKPANPNFNLTGIDTPFRMCVNAPSGSGKTNFLVNLIGLFCQGKGTFDKIFIITKNADEPLYNWLKSKCDQIIITEGLHTTPQLDKFDKRVNTLVVWDDLVLSKDLTMVENYYIRARKLSVSVIFLSQSYYDIPKVIRKNSDILVILKLGGLREIKMILADYGLGVSKDQLLGMYEFATDQKLSPLIIRKENPPDTRFSKGFLQYLNPAAFGAPDKA